MLRFALLFVTILDTSKTDPKDCFQLRTSGLKSNGVYTIYPDGSPVDVYCDMETECGGWTVSRENGRDLTQSLDKSQHTNRIFKKAK